MKVYECILNKDLTIYIKANAYDLRNVIETLLGYKTFISLTINNTDYRVEFTSAGTS